MTNKPLTPQAALKILDDTVAQLSTDRKSHALLIDAVAVLQGVLDGPQELGQINKPS